MAAPTASDGDITPTGVGSSQGNDVGGCEFLLYRYLPQLVHLLNIESIRVYLIAEEFLSEDDMEKLTPNPPHYVGSQIVETLVKIVKRKGAKGLEKFLSALRKSVDAGYQPGHEELLELFKKDCLSTKHSPEMNLPLEEVGSDSQRLQDPVRLIEFGSTKEEKCDDDEEKLVDVERHSEEADQRRRKCRLCLHFVKWCCNNDSNVFRGVLITMMTLCLGFGVPQLTIGGIGVAVAETTDVVNATNATYCQLFFAPYHISVGGFLSALGLLLCIMLLWKAIKKSLSNTCKCLYNVIVYTLAIFVIVLIFSLFVSSMSGLVFFIYAAVYVFGSITDNNHCHHVPYYWAFVEIVITLLLVGLAILFTFVVSIHKIVKCLK